MKYENFQKVKSLMESIDATTQKIEKLKAQNITVRLEHPACYPFMSIGAWDSCEHPAKDYAISFVMHLIMEYESRLKIMYDELSLL